MKMSAMMFIPRNIHKSVTRYKMARKTRLRVVMPGKRTQLLTNERFRLAAHCLIDYLPITELLQVGVLDYATSRKHLDLHLFELLTLVKIFVGGDYTALDEKYAGKDSERDLDFR